MSIDNIRFFYGPKTWKVLREAGLADFTDEQFANAMENDDGFIGSIKVGVFGVADAYIEKPFNENS